MVLQAVFTCTGGKLFDMVYFWGELWWEQESLFFALISQRESFSLKYWNWVFEF